MPIILCGIGGVIFAFVGAIIPNKETIIYSAAFHYGPEYIERVLAIIEAALGR